MKYNLWSANLYFMMVIRMIVRLTLEDKKKQVKQPGFSPDSCCAVAEYRLRGTIHYAFGNSQMQEIMSPGINIPDRDRLHGEMVATGAFQRMMLYRCCLN